MTHTTQVLERRPSTMILGIILISYFMIILDNSIIFTGLPSIQHSLQLSDVGLSWVQSGYTLVFGSLLLFAARAWDLLGRRRVFVLGLAVFVLASFLIGIAPSGTWLIAARVIQGVGAAIVAPSSLALLSAHFDGPERARAVAAYGTVAGIGASVGLVLGGALADLFSWRAGFFLNVPIGIAMVIAAYRYLPADRPGRGRLDVAGAVLSTLGVGAIVYGVENPAEAGWASPVTIASILVGVGLLAALVMNESRVDQPIVPLALFRNRHRSSAYLVRLLFAGTMIAFFYFTTQFLQGVYGFNPLQAGLAFLPMTAVNFFVALPLNKLIARVGHEPVLLAGIFLVLSGMAWLSRLTPSTPYIVGVAMPLVLIGIGQGLAFAPMTALGITGSTAADAGAASGLVNTTHQLGSTLGIAILVSAGAHAGSLAERVTTAYTGGTIMLSLALVVVLALAWRPRRSAAAGLVQEG